MDLQNPPSGVFVPIARAILTAPAAFTAGATLSVPFDTIQFNKGSCLKVPAPPIAGFPLAVGPGLYLIQAQFSLSVTPATSVQAELICESGSQTDVAVVTWGSVNAGSIMLNSNQLASYAALQAGNAFAGVTLNITTTGAPNGNVNGAQILVFRMGQG